MLDLQTFEGDIQRLADERLLDVLDRLLDRLLNIPDDDVPEGACSYELYHDRYVGAKLTLRKLGFQLDFYWEDDFHRVSTGCGNQYQIQRNPLASRKHQIQERIGEISAQMKAAHTKMYANPCKTCTTCQSRRKKWPTPITL